MTRLRGALALAAGGAVAAVVHPAAVAVVGIAVLIAVTWVLLRLRPGRRSRWRRGWWLVALAVGPSTLAWLPGVVPDLLRPVSGAAAGAMILAGVTAIRCSRDETSGRTAAVEAGLAGLLVAYLAAVVASSSPTASLHLVALATEVAALWALVLTRWRDGDLRGVTDRFLTVAAAGLVAARALQLAVVLGGPVDLGPAAAALTAAALVSLGMAATSRELGEEAPPATRREDPLRVSQVMLVVAAVVVGPVMVGAHLLRTGPAGLLLVVSAGAAVATASVLYLLQLVREHGRLAWRARHDALTSLPTEPLFEDRLEQAMARARRSGSGLAVAFLDLDGFKRVNDRDGHETGDEVLRRVALRLRGALREQDTVARRSGDEFLVLLPGVDNPEDAERVAAKLVRVLRSPIEVGGQQFRIGASIGLALWPRDGATAEELIRHADAAMYEVKEARGGAVRWYTRATTVRTRLRFTLAQQLEEALATSDQIQLAYQPRVDLRDGRVVGLVALVRWRHPELGLLTPRSFLPIAAEAGLTEELDLHVLERACADASQLNTDGLLAVPVTIHLSDRHVVSPRLEEDVIRAMRRVDLAVGRLVLAVTESGLERGGDMSLRQLGLLAEAGVPTMISRFGTGALALGTLARLPAGRVELASSHVAETGGLTSPVVDAALAVAERFGLDVTANGVTNELQVAGLREIGCVAARGPHLAPPLLGETLAGRLSRVSGETDHDPAAVPASALITDPGAAFPDNPEFAAVLAAAVHVDAEVEEAALSGVLSLLEGAGEPVPAEPAARELDTASAS